MESAKTLSLIYCAPIVLGPPPTRFRKMKRESKYHKREKERVAKILREEGWVSECEVPFPCWSPYANRRKDYHVDVCASKTPRTIIVEVDGFKYHGATQDQILRDRRRTEDIKNAYGQFIEVFRFQVSELERATDEEILKAIG